jgi:hypothetical protein
MKLVNRCVLIIRPRQPYLDWAKSVGDGDPEGLLGPVVADTTAFLAPDVDDPDRDPERILRQLHRQIFEHELEAWWTDENDWPTPRDLRQFKSWFEVEIHTVVADLGDEPLETEELG